MSFDDAEEVNVVLDYEGEIKMYEEKINSAVLLIKEYVNSNFIKTLDPESLHIKQTNTHKAGLFLKNIKLMGATDEEKLKSLSYEDILKCIDIDSEIKPVILAKEIAKIFRGKEEKSSKKVDKMNLRELLENYDVTEPTSPIGKRLKEVSKGDKFLVFSEGRNIDVETSLKLLEEIRLGYEGRDSIEVNGQIKEIYAYDHLPENYADENPLYKNRPLRPDGTCDQTNRSWQGIPLEIRQFIRVCVDTGELSINIDKAHDTLDLVLSDDPMSKLKKRYRKSAIEFEKLKDCGNLPKLKMALNKNTPFANAKKVTWRN